VFYSQKKLSVSGDKHWCHKYNTRKKMVIHVKLYKKDIQKRVINVGTKLYNKMPGDIKEYESLL